MPQILNNTLVINQGWMLTVFLLSARLGALLLVTPILSALSITPMVRVLLVFSLAIGLSVGLPHVRFTGGVAAEELIAAIATEVLIGALLGLGVTVAFAAFSMAGSMLDVQIGFGIAQVFDPITRRQAPILTSLFNQLAVVVFLLGNGHHTLLRGLAYSLERFPPGRVEWASLNAGPVLKHAAGLFSLGFSLVAPVVFCVFLLEFALGVLTRNLPQMQMFALGVPLKIIVGMAALGLWFTGAQGVMETTYASIFRSWEALFR